MNNNFNNDNSMNHNNHNNNNNDNSIIINNNNNYNTRDFAAAPERSQAAVERIGCESGGSSGCAAPSTSLYCSFALRARD